MITVSVYFPLFQTMPGVGPSKLQPESNIAGSVPDTSTCEENASDEKTKPPTSLGGARSKSVSAVRAAGSASSVARRGSIKVPTLLDLFL